MNAVNSMNVDLSGYDPDQPNKEVSFKWLSPSGSVIKTGQGLPIMAAVIDG